MKKFLLTAIFAFIAAYVYSQERIAIFPFQDMENVLARNQAFMFYDEFSNEFANRNGGRFAVVERQDVDRLINTEMAFQLTDFSAQEKTAEMMRVQNATRVLSGTIGTLNDDNNRRTEIRITVSLYTYPDLVRLAGGTTLSVANTTELFSKIPELVQDMQNKIASAARQSISEEFLYEIVNGRTVTITGYTGNAATLNIPSQIDGLLVTSIGGEAFSDCRSLTSVTIPPSVTSIRNEAFSRCRSLTSVTIPSSVTSIGNEAFSGCSSLANITIPSSVTDIGNGAFFYCSSITSFTVDNRNPVYASINGVLFDKNLHTLIQYPAGRNQRTYTIPSSVTAIRFGAFSGYSNLTSITIPSSVTYIGEFAFSGCSNLTSIIIPSSVTIIDSFAFSGCSSLTSITIPSSVTKISYGALSDCRSLTSVTIPSSVTFIGALAFSGCYSLTSVTIPSSVTFIGALAFSGCYSLTSVTIPSSVTFIGNDAFRDCSSLTSVIIPSSVTSIGAAAFYGCRSLTSVTLSRRTQVGEIAFPPNTRIIYRD